MTAGIKLGGKRDRDVRHSQYLRENPSLRDPGYKVYENRHTLAFHDIKPRSPRHTLVTPRIAARGILDITADDFVEVARTAKKIGRRNVGVWRGGGIIIQQFEAKFCGIESKRRMRTHSTARGDWNSIGTRIGFWLQDLDLRCPERPERSALASSEEILDAHSERGRNLVQGFDCGIRRFDFDGALSMSKFFALDLSDSSLFCVCYVDNPSSAKIHYAVRRLRKKSSGAPIVVALLGAKTDSSAAKTEGAVTIAGNFAGTVKSIVESAIGEAGRADRSSPDSIGKTIEPTAKVS